MYGLCFRPLSGFFLFLPLYKFAYVLKDNRFPSPIGVLLISTGNKLNVMCVNTQFPSPIGVLLISTTKLEALKKEFPSFRPLSGFFLFLQ